MADGPAGLGASFTVGDPSRRSTAEDLERLEQQLDECQARVDELSAGVSTPPAPLCDPRHRTLPEDLARYEASLATHVAALEEARSVLRACEIAVEEAQPGSRGDLSSSKRSAVPRNLA